MALHSLKSYIGRGRKRIGRGGKRGSYSGRGVKGQKSRAGRRIRPAERDLIIRIPKRRGFRNKELNVQPYIVNLEAIAEKTKHVGDKKIVVDKSFLKQFKLIPMRYNGEVKVLGNGEIKLALILQGIRASESAKMKIEKAGGSVK